MNEMWHTYTYGILFDFKKKEKYVIYYNMENS